MLGLRSFSRLSASRSVPSAFALATPRLASVAWGRRLLYSSPITLSWGGKKLKTHTGTAKRFSPVGSRSIQHRRAPALRSDLLGGAVYEPADEFSARKSMFKRGQTGKRHLNSKMHHAQTSRLRGTRLVGHGHTMRTLDRLIGSHS